MQAPAPQRALALASATPEEATRLATLPLAESEQLLGALRRALAGEPLEALADCPACGSVMEFACSLSDLLPALAPPVQTETRVEAEGWAVRVRLPRPSDLEQSAVDADPARCHRALLQRVVLSALHDGAAADITAAPIPVVAAVEARLAQLDPAGSPAVQLVCESCDHHWTAPFDIGAFFGAELGRWVERTLRQVHELALAYGWTEPVVLALTPRRRSMYLAMAAGR